MSKPLRLDRLLANCGVGSRSQVDLLIRRGAVRVGDSVLKDPAAKVAELQFTSITVEDEKLDHPHGISVLLHKPVGYACSHDEREAPTVDELLPPQWARRTPRPEWAGRLDRDTSGLLLVTDDHQLIHRVTSPKHHVAKRYEVTLCEPLADLERSVTLFASGSMLLPGETKPCAPAVLVAGAGPSDPLRVDITLHEGRFHQVRRMIGAVGGEVVGLHRVSFGEHQLGDLAVGTWCDSANS